MSNRSRKKLDVGITDAGPAWWASGVEPGCERPPWWQTSLDDELEFFALSVELAVVFGRLMKVGDDVILSHLLEVAELSLTAPDPPKTPGRTPRACPGTRTTSASPSTRYSAIASTRSVFPGGTITPGSGWSSRAGSSWRPWPGR